MERWSDADPAADPWGTPDGDNEDDPVYVSEYGFSDYGQREDVGDLEDGPTRRSPMTRKTRSNMPLNTDSATRARALMTWSKLPYGNARVLL